MNKIAFYFAEEGPGRRSKDIKKECNVNCFDFIFFLQDFIMSVQQGSNAPLYYRAACSVKDRYDLTFQLPYL
jgi:hypothetical protein